jgi:hypothetical protein
MTAKESMTDNVPVPNTIAFADLREERLHLKVGVTAWDDYYARIAPFVASSDASIRDSAIERICMAVFRAEPMNARRSNDGNSIARLGWLRNALENASTRYPDVRHAFLEHMVYHGDDEPFAAPLCAWLGEWLAAAADPRLLEMIRGALILHEPYPGAAAQAWITLVDDESDYVRACAAKRLGDWCDETTTPTATSLFDLVGAKDIQRPGVAGPFWSGHQYKHCGKPVPAEWMLDILAKRLNSEPANLPFNGIDFHLHELCDSSPESVELILRLGHKELALETALERGAAVSGMRPILVRFGDDPDPNVAVRAIQHLAIYYCVLHARAAEFHVNRLLNWDTRAIAFKLQVGEDPHARRVNVLYPREGSSFTDDDAWALINRVVDPTRRGPLLPHELASDDAPAPYRLGSQLLFRFGRANIELQGDVDAKLWTRLEIHT